MGSSSKASSRRSTVVSPSKVMPLVFPAANSASSLGFCQRDRQVGPPFGGRGEVDQRAVAQFHVVTLSVTPAGRWPAARLS